MNKILNDIVGKTKLAFEQRQEAERLMEQALADPDVLTELIYELISLRQYKQLKEARHKVYKKLVSTRT